MNTGKLKAMTINEWLEETIKKFADAGIDSARLDALLIIEHVLDTPRAIVLAHTNMTLPATTLVKLNILRNQRIERIPIAYLLNKKEFYGRDFIVNKDVLIPRPETENMIDIVKSLRLNLPKILDVGTGSGCIAVTLALEASGSKVTATDISEPALKLAKINAKTLGAQVTFKKTSLFEDFEKKKFDVVCANLPYVPDGIVTSKEITKEPSLALFSGKEGLDIYSKFFTEIDKITTYYLLIEALESQHSKLKKLALAAGFKFIEKRDLILLFTTIG